MANENKVNIEELLKKLEEYINKMCPIEIELANQQKVVEVVIKDCNVEVWLRLYDTEIDIKDSVKLIRVIEDNNTEIEIKILKNTERGLEDIIEINKYVIRYSDLVINFPLDLENIKPYLVKLVKKEITPTQFTQIAKKLIEEIINHEIEKFKSSFQL